MEALVELGYPGLFVAAFLSATLLPIGSEVVLVTLLLSGLSPPWLVFVASVGNVLGSFVNYCVGYCMGKPALQRWFKCSEEDFIAAETRFSRYGKVSLLLAWVPLIGDPLTLVAGVLRVHWMWFLVSVSLGKSGRYVMLTLITLGLM